MNVMDLMAKIGLDNSEYNKALGDSESKFQGFGKTIASGAKTIGKVGVAAFAAIGSAIGGMTTALIKNAGETAAYADNIDKMSQKLGFSAEKYQEWDFILQHSGSSIESVKGALIKLEKAAETGGEAFERLGINQEQFLAMGSQEQFETAVAALQGVTDETERAKLAQELFGKSYMELMPLLNTSAEATEEMRQQVHELGGVMSDDAVKAGAQFQDSLQNLKTAMTGAKNNLMGEFLPSLSTAMDGLSMLFAGDESGIGKLKEGITSFAETVNKVLPTAIQTISGIAEALLSALPDLIGTIAEELPGILERAIPLVINTFVSLADAVVKALPSIMTAIQKNIGVISSGLTKILSAIGKIIMTLLPTLLPTLLKVGIQLIQELARGFSENASAIIQTIFELIDLIVNELTNPETLSTILECGIQIILAIAQGITENLPIILGSLGTVLSNVLGFFVTEGIPQILEGAIKLFETIGDGIGKAWNYITGKLGDLLLDILGTDGIGGWLIDITSKAKEMFEGIGLGIMHAGAWIWEKVTGLGEDILGWIGDGLGDIFDIGKNLVEGLWDGITSVGDWIKEKITGFGNGITGWLKDTLGISSPSKVTAWMGRMLDEGLVEGVEDGAPETFREIQGKLNKQIDNLELQDLDINANATVGMQARNNTPADKQAASIRELSDQIQEFIKNWPDEIIQVMIGDRQIDEILISGKNRITTRSGGQVNA